VDVFTMGGTIASVPDAAGPDAAGPNAAGSDAAGSHAGGPGGPGPGARPTLTADDLLAAVPGIAEVADVRGTSFRQFPSPELTFGDLFALAGEIRDRIDGGADGIVVTQGTDTLEETAFALDLLCEAGAPVVVTGAMRNPGLPGADGPANLLAAIRVAACAGARGLGATVVFNDEIHPARFVRKTHTTSPATFRSAPAGPLGWISESRVRLAARPGAYPRLPVPADAPAARVALVKLALGDDPGVIGCVSEAGYGGLVVEAYGGGHVPGRFVAPLAELALRMPVVLASRTGSGEMLRQTYGFAGGEMDLLGRGLISAGALDGLKARILLTLLLTREAKRQEIDEAFAAVGLGGSS
jgi:L-asparaginase